MRVRRPSPLALEYAADVAARVYDRPAPLRNGFIEAFGDDDPALAVLLRGGQGGAVRLKLLLSMLWFAVRPPHETEYPARGWAALLDLPEHETNGARRVSAAVTWLAMHKFLRVEGHPGQPSTVFLLDERGTGDPYVPPFRALEQRKEQDAALDRDDYWVKLPHHFWTKGWLSVLSGPAVAMLLVLLDEAAYKNSTTALWHSPAQARRRFALSPDTRTQGLLELEAYRIVDMHRTPISPGVFDFKRMRNVYDLHREILTVEPGQPRPPVAAEVDIDALLGLDEATDPTTAGLGA